MIEGIGKCHCIGQGRCCSCEARLFLLRVIHEETRMPPMVLFGESLPEPLPGEGPYDPEDPYD